MLLLFVPLKFILHPQAQRPCDWATGEEQRTGEPSGWGILQVRLLSIPFPGGNPQVCFLKHPVVVGKVGRSNSSGQIRLPSP